MRKFCSFYLHSELICHRFYGNTGNYWTFRPFQLTWSTRTWGSLVIWVSSMDLTFASGRQFSMERTFFVSVLNLWDCGGQESFMEQYFASQKDNIFRNVEVLIYVFDVESRELDNDMHYYQSCLEAIYKVSPTISGYYLIRCVCSAYYAANPAAWTNEFQVQFMKLSHIL